jgi:hypothetical protein
MGYSNSSPSPQRTEVFGFSERPCAYRPARFQILTLVRIAGAVGAGNVHGRASGLAPKILFNGTGGLAPF